MLASPNSRDSHYTRLTPLIVKFSKKENTVGLKIITTPVDYKKHLEYNIQGAKNRLFAHFFMRRIG